MKHDAALRDELGGLVQLEKLAGVFVLGCERNASSLRSSLIVMEEK